MIGYSVPAMAASGRVERMTLSLPDGWTCHAALPAGEGDRGDFVHPIRDNEPGWREFLLDLIRDSAGPPGCEVLKWGMDGQVLRGWIAMMGVGRQVICRQHRPAGGLKRIAGLFRSTPERKLLERAAWLLEAGIATARPLALLERGGFDKAGWLITDEVPDAVDLDQFVLTILPRLEPGDRRNAKRALGAALATLLEQLERRGLYHRDLKASNILLTDWCDVARLRLWIVDLEGLRRRGWWGGRRWQPVVRLAASLLDYATITRSDFGRFLRVYLDRAGIPKTQWRARFGELGRKARVYREAARRRKQGKLDGYLGEA